MSDFTIINKLGKINEFSSVYYLLIIPKNILIFLLYKERERFQKFIKFTENQTNKLMLSKK